MLTHALGLLKLDKHTSHAEPPARDVSPLTDERPTLRGAGSAHASAILTSWVALVPVPSAVLECALAVDSVLVLGRANLAPFIPLGRCFGRPREVRSIVRGVRTGVKITAIPTTWEVTMTSATTTQARGANLAA
jgi:hypothetical protein